MTYYQNRHKETHIQLYRDENFQRGTANQGRRGRDHHHNRHYNDEFQKGVIKQDQENKNPGWRQEVDGDI